MIIEELQKNTLLGLMDEAIKYPLLLRISMALWMLHEDLQCQDTDASIADLMLRSATFKNVGIFQRAAISNYVRDISKLEHIRNDRRLRELAQPFADELVGN